MGMTALTEIIMVLESDSTECSAPYYFDTSLSVASLHVVVKIIAISED